MGELSIPSLGTPPQKTQQSPQHSPQPSPSLVALTTFLKLAQQLALVGLVSRATVLCKISPVLSLGRGGGSGQGREGKGGGEAPLPPTPAAHLRVLLYLLSSSSRACFSVTMSALTM